MLRNLTFLHQHTGPGELTAQTVSSAEQLTSLLKTKQKTKTWETEVDGVLS